MPLTTDKRKQQVRPHHNTDMRTLNSGRNGLATIPIIIIVAVIAAVIFLVMQSPRDAAGDVDGPTTINDEPGLNHEAAEVAAGATRTGVSSRTEENTPATARIARGRVSGSVQNTAGEGIANAIVVLTKKLSQADAFSFDTRKRGSIPTFRRTTRADGTFSFDRLPANSDYDMWVRHQQYAPKQGVPVRALGDDQYLPPVVLNKGYKVFGQITDEGGNPLAATVDITLQATRYIPRDNEEKEAEDNELGRKFRVGADQNGNFSIELLAQGMWTLLASHDGYATAQIHPIVLMGDRMEMEQNLILGSEHILAGVVLTGDGEPIADAKVSVSRMRPRPLFSTQLRSNHDGTFEVRGLSEGIYGIAAMAPGYSNGTLPRVKSNKTDLELILHKKGSVSGRISDTFGNPVTSFKIQVARVNRGTSLYTPSGSGQTFKSESGDFTVEGIEPGSYRLLVSANSHAPTYSSGFSVQRELVQGIDVQMQLGGTLVGSVVNSLDGSPIAGATINIHGKDWSDDNSFGLFGGSGPDPNNVPAQSAVTGKDGKFKLENVFSAELLLEATHPSFLSTTFLVTMHTGSNVDVGSFKLESGGSVTGIGLYGDGRPLAGGTAYVTRQTDSGFGYFSDNMRLDSRGRFQFEGLRSGSYKVSVSSAEGSGMMFLVEVDGSTKNIYVQAGRNVEVELTAQQ